MKSLKQVRKTRSYKLERSSSAMEYQITSPSDHHYSTGYVTKKSPPPPPHVEFPTSPQLIFGEEILHFSHPQHPLSMVDLPDLFNCVGCKEYGSGKRFVCQQCDFQLHDFCALAPPALKAHPFHSQHSVLFHSKPGKPRTYIHTYIYFLLRCVWGMQIQAPTFQIKHKNSKQQYVAFPLNRSLKVCNTHFISPSLILYQYECL